MNNITIENARIGFRNFSGEEGKYNKAGDRNFAVFIENEKDALVLKEDGWNIKYLEPRDPDDDGVYFLKVKIRYNPIPPKIVFVTGGNKTILDEESVSILDYTEIEQVDIIIRPYEYSVNGMEGVAAYVKTMYVVVHEDELEKKYADIPTEEVDQ